MASQKLCFMIELTVTSVALIQPGCLAILLPALTDDWVNHLSLRASLTVPAEDRGSMTLWKCLIAILHDCGTSIIFSETRQRQPIRFSVLITRKLFRLVFALNGFVSCIAETERSKNYGAPKDLVTCFAYARKCKNDDHCKKMRTNGPTAVTMWSVVWKQIVSVSMIFKFLFDRLSIMHHAFSFIMVRERSLRLGVKMPPLPSDQSKFWWRKQRDENTYSVQVRIDNYGIRPAALQEVVLKLVKLRCSNSSKENFMNLWVQPIINSDALRSLVRLAESSR